MHFYLICFQNDLQMIDPHLHLITFLLPPWYTQLTSLNTAILHKSCITQAEIRSRADAIGTSIRTISHAHEGIRPVHNISIVTIANIRSATHAIQTRLLTMRLTTWTSGIKGPSSGTGTLFRGNTRSTATTPAANGLTLIQVVLCVSFLAGTHIRTDTITIRTVVVTHRQTLLVRRVFVSLIAQTLVRSNAGAVQTTLGAFGDTKLLRWIQFVAWFANATVSVTTHAILTANGTSGDALLLVVEDIVRITGTEIGGDTEAINALLFTDRITFTEVVRILDVTIATDVDQTEGGMGLKEEKLTKLLRICDEINLLHFLVGSFLLHGLRLKYWKRGFRGLLGTNCPLNH